MEYKFRGFDATGQKGWVYGDLVHNKKVTESGLEDRVMVGGYEVLPNSVGLFTGMTDKNGKEIFEGDVVIRHEEPFGFDITGIIRYDSLIGAFVICRKKDGDISSIVFRTSESVNDGYCTVEVKYTYETNGTEFDLSVIKVVMNNGGNVYMSREEFIDAINKVMNHDGKG